MWTLGNHGMQQFQSQEPVIRGWGGGPPGVKHRQWGYYGGRKHPVFTKEQPLILLGNPFIWAPWEGGHASEMSVRGQLPGQLNG